MAAVYKFENHSHCPVFKIIKSGARRSDNETLEYWIDTSAQLANSCAGLLVTVTPRGAKPPECKVQAAHTALKATKRKLLGDIRESCATQENAERYVSAKLKTSDPKQALGHIVGRIIADLYMEGVFGIATQDRREADEEKEERRKTREERKREESKAKERQEKRKRRDEGEEGGKEEGNKRKAISCNYSGACDADLQV